MDTSTHSMNTLFAQLGLPNTDAEIDRFIANHRLFTSSVPIAEASFWTEAQASFLRESLEQDSDWSEMVDVLDSRLRQH